MSDLPRLRRLQAEYGNIVGPDSAVAREYAAKAKAVEDEERRVLDEAERMEANRDEPNPQPNRPSRGGEPDSQPAHEGVNRPGGEVATQGRDGIEPFGGGATQEHRPEGPQASHEILGGGVTDATCPSSLTIHTPKDTPIPAQGMTGVGARSATWRFPVCAECGHPYKRHGTKDDGDCNVTTRKDGRCGCLNYVPRKRSPRLAVKASSGSGTGLPPAESTVGRRSPTSEHDGTITGQDDQPALAAAIEAEGLTSSAPPPLDSVGVGVDLCGASPTHMSVGVDTTSNEGGAPHCDEVDHTALTPTATPSVATSPVAKSKGAGGVPTRPTVCIHGECGEIVPDDRLFCEGHDPLAAIPQPSLSSPADPVAPRIEAGSADSLTVSGSIPCVAKYSNTYPSGSAQRTEVTAPLPVGYEPFPCFSCAAPKVVRMGTCLKCNKCGWVGEQMPDGQILPFDEERNRLEWGLAPSRKSKKCARCPRMIPAGDMTINGFCLSCVSSALPCGHYAMSAPANDDGMNDMHAPSDFTECGRLTWQAKYRELSEGSAEVFKWLGQIDAEKDCPYVEEKDRRPIPPECLRTSVPIRLEETPAERIGRFLGRKVIPTDAFDRHQGIGGSRIWDVVHDGMRAYCQLRGILPEVEETDAIKAGVYYEAPTVAWFCDETGHKAEGDGKLIVFHPSEPWAYVTPDRFLMESDAIIALLEVKFWSSFRAPEFEGEDYPDDIHYQVQWQLGVTGLPRCHLAIMLGGNKPQFSRVVEFDPEVFANLMKIAKAFWYDNVVAGVPPEVTGSDSSRDYLRARYKKVEPVMVDATPEVVEYAHAYVKASAEAKAATEAAALAKHRICDYIGAGEAEGVVLDEAGKWKATWKKGEDDTRRFNLRQKK